MAGMTIIDPRDPPLRILNAVEHRKLLLSEALPWLIVADALRVPWVAMQPLAAVHRGKWADWAATVQITLRPQTLPHGRRAEWLASSGPFCCTAAPCG